MGLQSQLLNSYNQDIRDERFPKNWALKKEGPEREWRMEEGAQGTQERGGRHPRAPGGRNLRLNLIGEGSTLNVCWRNCCCIGLVSLLRSLRRKMAKADCSASVAMQRKESLGVKVENPKSPNRRCGIGGALKRGLSDGCKVLATTSLHIN